MQNKLEIITDERWQQQQKHKKMHNEFIQKIL